MGDEGTMIEPDPFTPGGFTVTSAGIPQSHVNPADPRHLAFEYVRRIGHVIDLLAEVGRPITALHLGGGGLTLPRYIAATRPGSVQTVVELDRELTERVLGRMPLPAGADIRFIFDDAMAAVRRLATGTTGTVRTAGTAQLVVVDVYDGLVPPPYIADPGFLRELVGLLAPEGVVAVNVADGPSLERTRAQGRALGVAIPQLAALGTPRVLAGEEAGNVVLLGSSATTFVDWLPRLGALGPHPSETLSGAELAAVLDQFG
ncbi:spermidine synthase [Luethyella okanaganae]|uniref:Spermidine synthase n=1 Tax=Luethyella okanaganae TaxID=69372 RepID=A0ABW1VIJ0_9MICO